MYMYMYILDRWGKHYHPIGPLGFSGFNSKQSEAMKCNNQVNSKCQNGIIYMLFTGWEVRIGRNCAQGRAQTEGTVSPNTDRPRPVNNIYIFFLLRFGSFRKILLQPPTYVCWRRARSCWCYSKRAIDCKPKQNITTWFLTCNLYYHN